LAWRCEAEPRPNQWGIRWASGEGKGADRREVVHHSQVRRGERACKTEREGNGNGPYKGPSGTSGKITGHKEMSLGGRGTRKGKIKGKNGRNNTRVRREEISEVSVLERIVS
jgi:hypothetical protein